MRQKIFAFLDRHLFAWYWLCGLIGTLGASAFDYRDPSVPPLVHYVLSPVIGDTVIIGFLWCGVKLVQWVRRKSA